MVHSCVAWLEDEDRSNLDTGITAVADHIAVTSGDNLRLYKPLDKVAKIYCWTEFEAYPFDQFTVTAASIPTTNGTILLNRGINLTSVVGNVYDFQDAPLEIFKAGENISISGHEDDEATVAHYLGMVMIVCDGPIPRGPVPYSWPHRCTATATTAGSWTLLALTEGTALPSGDYVCVGAEVESATAVAARLNFPKFKYRPAVIPICEEEAQLDPFSRYWGAEIPFTMPDGLPQIDILECTGSGTVTVNLFVRKVG